jgi:hypothetical protein
VIVGRAPLPGEADPKLLPQVPQIDGNRLEVGDNASYDLMQGRVRGQPALIDILSAPMGSCGKCISMLNPLRQHRHCDLVRLDTLPTG